MSKLHQKIQRMHRHGCYLVKTNTPGIYEVFDRYGPTGVKNTKRTLVCMFYRGVVHQEKVRIYTTNSAGFTHRHNCPFLMTATSSNCKCHYLPANL